MPTDNELKLIEQLRGALKSRALVYAAMYEEIAAEFGADKAREICKRAIYKRGESIAHLFAPEVVQCTAQELEIQFHRCPLKEAWQEAGVDDGALENLCDIGGVVDYGTFEKAGFSITSDTWKRGREGCCRLHIRPGPAKT